VAAGAAAAFLVVTEVMNFKFVWLPWPAFAAALSALLVTVGLGLAGTFAALGQRPGPVLRNF
jgi:putative ABC transport system permease protein